MDIRPTSHQSQRERQVVERDDTERRQSTYKPSISDVQRALLFEFGPDVNENPNVSTSGLTPVTPPETNIAIVEAPSSQLPAETIGSDETTTTRMTELNSEGQIELHAAERLQAARDQAAAIYDVAENQQRAA